MTEPSTNLVNGQMKWQSFFQISPTRPDGTYWITIRLNSKRLTDDLMSEACAALDDFLNESLRLHNSQVQRNSPPGFGYKYRLCANVELAENQLTSVGCIKMLDLFEHHGVQCKAMRLYRNLLDDKAVIRLADMLSRQSEAIEELHLSHNRISAKGILVLLLTFVKHPQNAYPWLNKLGIYQPTWLKFDFNDIGRPQELVDVVQNVAGGIACTADDKILCGPSRCKVSVKDRKKSPVAHIQGFLSQNSEVAKQSILSSAGMVAIVKSFDIKHISETYIDNLVTRACESSVNSSSYLVSSLTSSSISSSSVSASTHQRSLPVDSLDRKQLVFPNDMWICNICEHVLRDPLVLNKCHHMFCRQCFYSYRDRVVSAERNRVRNPNAIVATLPCPSCLEPHSREDVSLMEQSAESLRKAYRDLKVLCRHHPSLYSLNLADGAALLIKTAFGNECCWEGYLVEYLNHLRNCEVESILRDQLAPRSGFAEVVQRGHNHRLNQNASSQTLQSIAKPIDYSPQASPTMQQQQIVSPKIAYSNGTTSCTTNAATSLHSSPVAPPMVSSPSSSPFVSATVSLSPAITSVSPPQPVYWIVTHEFQPSSEVENVLSLRVGDVLRISCETDQGWAAGMKVDPDTLTDLSISGWFPPSYGILFKPSNSKIREDETRQLGLLR